MTIESITKDLGFFYPKPANENGESAFKSFAHKMTVIFHHDDTPRNIMHLSENSLKDLGLQRADVVYHLYVEK